MASKLPEGCSLCLDSYTEPRQLPCEHNFCAKCLAVHIRSTTKNQQFKCPTCAKSLPRPDGDITTFTIKRAFPSAIEGNGDKHRDDTVQYCKEQGHRALQAQLFCKNHRCLICAKCIADVQLHKKCQFIGIEEEAWNIKSDLTKLLYKATKQSADIKAADEDFLTSEQQLMKMKSSIMEEHGQHQAALDEVISGINPFCTDTDVFNLVVKGRELETQLSKNIVPIYRVLKVKFDVMEIKSTAAPGQMFANKCGNNVLLKDCQKVAFRKDPDFNNNHGVVLTEDALVPGKLFEVHVDKVIYEWERSLGIGVTTNSPQSLKVPSGLIGMPARTLVLWSGHVHHNGRRVKENYAQTDFKVGDRVGVKVSQQGKVHFFINGKDLGPVAELASASKMYAAVDIFENVTQVSICT